MYVQVGYRCKRIHVCISIYIAVCTNMYAYVYMHILYVTSYMNRRGKYSSQPYDRIMCIHLRLLYDSLYVVLKYVQI